MENYSIVIVGCGATGSNIATFVSQLAISQKNIKDIVLIDGDTVETKNFINQKYTANDIGKNKARVLATRYKKLNVPVSYVDRYIQDSNDLINILEGLTRTVILVGSVDNNAARRIMNDTFYSDRLKKLIYIDTGNGDKDRVGQTVVGAKDNNIVIRPPVAEYYPQILIEDEKVEEKVEVAQEGYSCSAIQEHPQNLATNILSATTTFLIINNIVSSNRMRKCHFKFDAENIKIMNK